MKNIFVSRFGKLISTEQKNNFGKDGFHNAPSKCGFYCFDRRYIDTFLCAHVMYKNDLYHGEICGGFLWIHTQPKQKNLIIETYNSWYKIRAEDYHKIHNNTYYGNVWCSEYQMKYSKIHLELFCTDETIFTNIRKGFNKYKHIGKDKVEENWQINSDISYERLKYYKEYNENLKDD